MNMGFLVGFVGEHGVFGGLCGRTWGFWWVMWVNMGFLVGFVGEHGVFGGLCG